MLPLSSSRENYFSIFKEPQGMKMDKFRVLSVYWGQDHVPFFANKNTEWQN
uniref:Uncharacterized protein n=1 Tax=Anguilla anguilla TaxID=7936 RepID=A0A0E9QW01_ANGAN